MEFLGKCSSLVGNCSAYMILVYETFLIYIVQPGLWRDALPGRGELRLFLVLVDKWKPVSYGQKEMIDLFWLSFSLTQKKIYFLKLWWNGCFTNRAVLHAIKIALKDTPIIDVKIEPHWNTDIIWWVWCSHWRKESTGAKTKLFLSFHATVLFCCSVCGRGELPSNPAPSFRDVMLCHR